MLRLLSRLCGKQELDELTLGGAKQLGILLDNAILVLDEELSGGVGNLRHTNEQNNYYGAIVPKSHCYNKINNYYGEIV